MPAFETSGPISATIDVVVGDVRITAGDGAAAVIDVRPSDASSDEDVKAAERTRVEFADEHLLVKAPKLRNFLPRSHGGSIDVTIELPAGSKVRGAGQMTDFAATGRLGDSHIRTGMGTVQLDEVSATNVKTGIGDITVERATGHAELTSGSGDVRAGELGATAVIKNSNGDTWVGSVAGDLRVQAANGSIAVDHAGASVVAKSSNGDVRLGSVARGSVVLETSLGDLEVGIPDGVPAYLDARAVAGRVQNSLEPGSAPDASADSVEVRARTTAGNVVIRRS
jgi:putative adhesin